MPYTGYASAPLELNLSSIEIVNRRHGGNFDAFGGAAPNVLYYGENEIGKQTARGLEQYYYEVDLRAAGGDTSKVANSQNPIGVNNPRGEDYKEAANKYLNKDDGVGVGCKP